MVVYDAFVELHILSFYLHELKDNNEATLFHLIDKDAVLMFNVLQN